MRKNLLVILLVTVSLILTSCGLKPDLVVYAPQDYVSKDVRKVFEKEHGVRVKVEPFNSNEIMIKNIKENPGSYDVVIPSDYSMEELAVEGYLEKIDWDKLTTIKKEDLDKSLKGYIDELKEQDFDLLEYSVPYFYGSIGLIYNNTNKELEKDVKELGWSIMTNKNYTRFLYDSSRDAYMVALAHANKTLSMATEADINDATAWLKDVKNISSEVIRNGKKVSIKTTIQSDQIIEEAIGGNTPYDVAVVYSGDATLILQETSSYSFYIPEISNVWVDGLSIPKASNNIDLAYEFINWFSDYDNQIENTIEVGYTPVREDVINYFLKDSDYNNERVKKSFLVEDIRINEFYRYDKNLFNLIEKGWRDVRTS